MLKQCVRFNVTVTFSAFFMSSPLSGAAPPWSEYSASPPPHYPVPRGTEPLYWGHRSHYAGDIGVSERGRDTRRLVTIAWSRGQLITRPAAAQPPCRSKYFLVITRKYFSCPPSPSHRERVPASSSHQIFNIQFVILNITLCFPSTYTTKMSLLSPYSSVKLQRDS